MITGIHDVEMINLCSNDIYERLQREWFSTDENSEIHRIASNSLFRMSEKIARKKFSRDRKLDWENLASDATLHVYTRGMVDFITNPEVQAMEPGRRYARLNNMLANAMFTSLRTERRATTVKIKIEDDRNETFPKEWNIVQDADQPDTVKRRKGKISNPKFIYEAPTSIDTPNEEGSTLIDLLADNEPGWLEREIDKINMDEKEFNVHQALLAFFSQETTGLDKLLVVGCCWVAKALRRDFSRKDFNDWLASNLNGHTRKSAFQYLKKTFPRLNISTAVLKPLVPRLTATDADGRQALDYVMNIVTGNVTKWSSDMRGRMERWNDNNDKVIYLRSKSKEDNNHEEQ